MKFQSSKHILRTLAVLPLLAMASFANESLLIGPGDLLHIQVFDTPEMDQHVRVTDAGSAPLIFLGPVTLVGLTPGQAAALIEHNLVEKKMMVQPQVTVSIEQLATQNVSVLGQVHTPGTYPITTPLPVTRILSMAGGITDIADRHITIERHGTTSETVTYFFANDADAAVKDAPIVNPGDSVIVPKAPVVYVLGDVGRPGGYPMVTNDARMSVLQLLANAGSLNKTSLKSRITLIRKTASGTEELPLQLAEIEKGKAPDIALRSDDIIYVPFSWMKNMALSSASIAASASGSAIYAIH